MMGPQLNSIAAILVSTVFFLMGNGLVNTLTPLRASIEGYSFITLGLLGTFYFGGFIAGCLAGPHLLARTGHIRAYAMAAALTSVSVLVQALLDSALIWLVLRAISGFAIAILFMGLESWLNDRATNETRGRILSTYVIVNLSALILGQWLLLAAPPESFALFSVGAIAYCLCLIPVTLTQLPQPVVRPAPELNIARLFNAAPVGAAGCLTVGLANGAFWTLGPVYAQSLGFAPPDIALFMTVFIAGGAVVQWPLGRLSDGMDRRWIIAGICTIAAICGLVLGAFGWLLVRSPDMLFIFVFLLGASMLPLYSLSIAHANDRLERSEFVQASAGLLMIMAAMSVPGPLLAAFLTTVAGTQHALFLFTALAHAAMAFFAFTRTRMREAPPLASRDSFAPVPQTSPASLPLDPRSPEPGV
jgi:MFS family permease